MIILSYFNKLKNILFGSKTTSGNVVLSIGFITSLLVLLMIIVVPSINRITEGVASFFGYETKEQLIKDRAKLESKVKELQAVNDNLRQQIIINELLNGRANVLTIDLEAEVKKSIQVRNTIIEDRDKAIEVVKQNKPKDPKDPKYTMPEDKIIAAAHMSAVWAAYHHANPS